MGNNVNDLRKQLSKAEKDRSWYEQQIRDKQRLVRLHTAAARSQRKAKLLDQAAETDATRAKTERAIAAYTAHLNGLKGDIAALNAQIKKCR